MIILSDQDKARLKQMATDMGIYTGDPYYGPDVVSSDVWFVKLIEKILDRLNELTPR